MIAGEAPVSYRLEQRELRWRFAESRSCRPAAAFSRFA